MTHQPYLHEVGDLMKVPSNNILDWIDDKGYQEGSLDTPEALASRQQWWERIHQIMHVGSPVYGKMSDGCCHKTVLERCADCPFKEK